MKPHPSPQFMFDVIIIMEDVFAQFNQMGVVKLLGEIIWNIEIMKSFATIET
jgi:hypothetical protein